MSKTSYHQRALAQNFLKSSKLVRSLLSASSVTAEDIVYEIGPGRGLITRELAQIARNVIAVEKDSFLVEELCRRFQDVENV